MSENLCPCGSQKELAACCAPYLEGKTLPPDAESLVRSRYAAFCLEKFDYLVETTHPDFRDDLSVEALRENVAGLNWLRLDIQGTGTAPGQDGASFDTVTFSALYEREGKVYQMGETSYFTRQNDRLYYVEGMSHRPLGYRRTAPKVGRNDPCPCGSGKKYKKCCAAKEDTTE